MADAMARLVAKLDVDRRGFDKGLKGGTSELKSFVASATRIAAPLAAVFGGREILRLASERQQAERKLAAVLKATGGAAGFGADQLKRYAAELRQVTNFTTTETINAQGILATFTKVQGDVFREAIGLAQDMSSVMGSDLKGSVIQLGKALNAPITGVSALAEIGVSFTEQQREMIKALMETGDVMGAQKVILAELKNEFGGAAQAMADDATQLQNAMEDLATTLGKFTAIPAAGVLNALRRHGTAVGQRLAGDFAADATIFGEAFRNFGQDTGTMEFARTTDLGGGMMGLQQLRPPSTEISGLDESRRAVGQILDQMARESRGDAIRSGANRVNRFFKDLSIGFETFALDAEFGFKKAVQAQEEWIASQEEIQDLFMRTRTEEERFRMEQARLTKLFRAGRIDADLFERGLMAAAPESSADPRADTPINRAIERGTTEAFEAMVRAATPESKQREEERRHEEIKALMREEIRLQRDNQVEVERWQ